jgi:hypothetical protein
MQVDSLTPSQRRTLAARNALRDKLGSEQARSDHYREIGARGNAERLTLSGEERAALSEAYDLLHRIAARHGLNQADAAENGGEA